MQLNLKSAMAAVALALLASTANAALPPPSGANGSDLILNVWNANDANQGYTLDTGIVAGTWNPAVAFSVTITNAGVLAAYNNTGTGLGGTAWNVTGAQGTGQGTANSFWTTVDTNVAANLGSGAGDAPASVNSAVSAAAQAFLVLNNNGTSQSSDGTWANSTAQGGSNLTATTEALGSGSLYFARYQPAVAGLVSLYSGTWSLVWNGAQGAATSATLSWTPTSVPVPAALWLLGSGLLGVAGVGRRRQTLNAA